MHPLILEAVRKVEGLRALADSSPLEKPSRVYHFLMLCEEGMRRVDPQFHSYEIYFDKTFRLLEDVGIAPTGPDV